MLKVLPKIKHLTGLSRLLVKLNQSTSQKDPFKYDVVSPQSFEVIKRKFPSDIQLPSYYETGLSDDDLFEDNISVYEDLSRDSKTIEGVRNSCQLAKQILQNVVEFIKAGMSGEEIDEFVYQQCLKFKCYPSPLNYLKFPKCVTLSVNNVAIHGIPDVRQLTTGDILTVDVSVLYKGFHGDTATTVLIGKDRAIDHDGLSSNLVESNVIDFSGLNLIKTARRCLIAGIEVCKAGAHLNEIGYAIEKEAKEAGLNVVPSVCGHSLGEYLHGQPQIVHCPYDEYTEDDVLLENMLLTIEPVICEFEPDVELLEDGWTVRTVDQGRTAQFEHTILVKQTHAEILT